MAGYYYDLHIHSCLSPCGDNDMTPNNIAGMSVLAGLNIVALTDHNSCKNCPAFFTACESNGIIPLAGMELTTAEDIHMVCLFDSLEAAMQFDNEVDMKRIKIRNRVDIFGEQLILDDNDKIIGNDDFLLPNATSLSLEEGFELCEGMGGVAYPAHIDRHSNGIIATLSTFPDTPAFTAAELRDARNISEYRRQFSALEGKRLLVCSDAHYLTDIRDAANLFECSATSPDEVRKALIRWLKQE